MLFGASAAEAQVTITPTYAEPGTDVLLAFRRAEQRDEADTIACADRNRFKKESKRRWYGRSQ
jgi:hypothetical protein